ncbi:MAG: NADH-quinone oxidoreductase subunit A [Myxococcales bacterium]|nr:NADH-quinone oxidoreductase subunit A [Myxococcales bacterium]
MIASYIPMFLIIAVGILLATVFFLGSTFLGPKQAKGAEHNTPYESGSESSGGRHVRLSVKFYLTAILFVVFDIEAVFLYPWGIKFRSFGWLGLVEMLGFLGVLVIGLVYCWKKGALEWET